MNVLDRRRGCLIGLMVGDALGQSVEFMSHGSFEPITGYRSGGPHGLEKGQWTDDSSLALALADSIANMGWNLTDQLKRYVDWWQNGTYSVNGWCFDIGGTTKTALHNFMEKGVPSASSHEGDSGNGSIMRLAPVPIKYYDFYPNRLTELSIIADDSSRTTHASSQCRSACRYMATVLAALINGEERDKVLAPNWRGLEDLIRIAPLDPKILAVAKGSYRAKKPPEIQGSGWVVQSLEAALWAFHDATDFKEAALRAVNLGDDADTTGAVCGQFAGAFWGESGIPMEFRDGLARMDMVEKALVGLTS